MRSQPGQILESLLYPNKLVEPGYGVLVLTMRDGTMPVGTPAEDAPQAVTRRTPDGDVKKIAKSSIQERMPPVSPMPPPWLGLTKRDLRDLMAFGNSLAEPLPERK